MKIKKVESNFKSLVITIETKKEANCLWHILNCASNRRLINYIIEKKKEEGREKIDGVGTENFKNDLWDKLSELYYPDDEII